MSPTTVVTIIVGLVLGRFPEVPTTRLDGFPYLLVGRIGKCGILFSVLGGPSSAGQDCFSSRRSLDFSRQVG